MNNSDKLYKCYRCFYTSPKKCNLQTHLNRVISCKRSPESHYTDEEIKLLNKEQLDKKKNNAPLNNNSNNDTNLEHSNVHSHNNTTNTINSNNITNNINIKIDNLIPFDEDWDLSKIDKYEKSLLLFSQVMYTKLLEKILDNEINSNVIIDKYTDSGLVYTNTSEEGKKYITMDFENIIKKSMQKLNKQLNDIFSDYEDDLIKNFIPEELKKNILHNKRLIDIKYFNFKDDTGIKNMVNDFIQDIYNNNKENALKMLKEHNEKEQNENKIYLSENPIIDKSLNGF
jgi:hypothetical protein